MLPLRIQLELPSWVIEVADVNRRYHTDEERVGLAVELAGHNRRDAGGPFAAAVFNAHNGRLVAVGLNRVVDSGRSIAHAETLALILAQQRAGRPRLNAGGGHFVLATSTQPCCQCYGAIIWAGIDELLIGARAEDAETLAGFDEGPLPTDWIGELERRGIAVRRDILRDEACRVLAAYGTTGPRY